MPIPIQLYYKNPFTFWLTRKMISAELPISWDEATPKFWQAYSKWMLDTPIDEKYKARYEFLFDALPFPVRILKKITKAVGNDIIQSLTFLEQPIKTNKVALKSIKVDNQTWHFGPEHFYEMTVGQFITCENAYNRYCANKDVKYLNVMIASLYKPLDKDGLLPVGEYHSITRMAAVEKYVEFDVKKTVLLNFIALLNFLSEHRDLKILFRKPENSNPLNAINSNNVSSTRSWPRIIYTMSGPQLGSVDEVEAKPLFYFLMRLADRLREDRENRRKNRK